MIPILVGSAAAGVLVGVVAFRVLDRLTERKAFANEITVTLAPQMTVEEAEAVGRQLRETLRNNP